MLSKFTKLLFSLSFFLLLITISGNIDSIDTITHISLAKRIITERRIYFKPQEEKKLRTVSTLNKNDGNYYSVYNPLYSIIQIPGIVFSEFLHKITNTKIPDYPYELDFFIPIYTCILNALIGYLIIKSIYEILYLIKRKKVSKIETLTVVIGFFSTNLFVQTHHVFAHLLFSLFFLKTIHSLIIFFSTKEKKYLFYSSLFFLLTAISYNSSFILLTPLLLFLILFLNQKNLDFNKLSHSFKYFITLILPGIVAQSIWNILRFNHPLKTGYFEYGHKIYNFNLAKFLENLNGLTFSPSKSLFIFNPIIILVLFFSLFSLKKFFSKKKKEILVTINVSFLILLLTYLFNYSLVNFWHGDSAYGPRYLTPVIVYGLLILSINYKNLKKILKLFTYILFFIGFFIQIPGILIPHFVYLNISPDYCRVYENRYFKKSCSPIWVGWLNLLYKRIDLTINAIKKDNFKTFFISEISFPFILYNTPYYPWNLKLPSTIYFKIPNKLEKKELSIFFTVAKDWGGDNSLYENRKYNFYINNKFIYSLFLKDSNSKDFEIKIPHSFLREKRNYNQLTIKIDDNYQKNIEKKIDYNKNFPDLIVINFKINDEKVNMRNLRTIYPDPFFNKFSSWKTQNYRTTLDLYQNIYNEFLDLFFVKILIYKNIISI